MATQKDAELVPGKARDQAITFDDFRQASGNDPEHLVAEPVAIEIVDRLEMIEVHDEERADFILKQMIGPSRELFEEAAPIGKAGQGVMTCKTMRRGSASRRRFISRRRSTSLRQEKTIAIRPRQKARANSSSTSQSS